MTANDEGHGGPDRAKVREALKRQCKNRKSLINGAAAAYAAQPENDDLARQLAASEAALGEAREEIAAARVELLKIGRFTDRDSIVDLARAAEELNGLHCEDMDDLRRRMAAALALVDELRHVERSPARDKIIELLTVEEGAKPEPAPTYRHPEAEANDKDGG